MTGRSSLLCSVILCTVLDAPAFPADIRFLPVPDGGIQPQIAVGDDGTIHLVYFRGNAGAGDLFYIRRAAGASEFSGPIQANSQSGSAIAFGSIRGAQLALGKAGRVHVAWNGSGRAEPRGPGKHDSPMLYTRLGDDGSAFEPQRNMIGDAYGLDGGGSVAADARGNVSVVWHAGNGGEDNRRVWMVRSRDDGDTFDSETAIDREQLGACGCCGLKAFAGRDEELFVLYRSAREGVNRDMHLLSSNAGGRRFASQPLDKWKIATCPMSSATFASGNDAGNDALYAAWETNGQVQYSRIDRETQEAAKAIAPPGQATNRKHPALAVNRNGALLLVWTEGTGWQKGGALAWQEFDAQDKPTKVRGRKDGIPVWSFAAAFAEPDGSFTIFY